MRKKTQSRLVVQRIDSSPYFSSTFQQKEKEKLESIEGVEYAFFNTNIKGNIFITNTHTKIAELDTDLLKNCQLIIHANSGYDNYPLNFVKEAKFPIIIGNSIRAHAVANYILSAIFEHYSKIPSQVEWDKTRRWNRKLLSELHVQLIGFGTIGKILEKSLSPIVKSISIYDPDKGWNDMKWDLADVIIPICSQNPTSLDIINHKILSHFKQDFLLINAARGGLVNLHDLIISLEKKNHAFAYLDVFPNEPYDFTKINHLKNLKLTSHIAGVFEGLDELTLDFEKNVVQDFQELELNDFLLKYKNDSLNSRIRDNYLL